MTFQKAHIKEHKIFKCIGPFFKNADFRLPKECFLNYIHRNNKPLPKLNFKFLKYLKIS